MQLRIKSGGVALRLNKAGKVSSDGRFIAGYASVFDVVDYDGDVTKKGTFTRSLQERSQVPLLRMHDNSRPIGKTLLLVEDDTGLLFKARISDTPDGNEMLTLIGDQVVSQMSIGYAVRNEQRIPVNGGYANHLRDVSLFEVSPVLYGSNSATSVALSKAGRFVILDAICIVEYEQKEREGKRPGQWDTKFYLEACQRQIERQLYGGRTEQQMRYERLFYIQEELAELERIMR